jgi:cobyrinic acid a,c-diamide synthase
MTDRVPSGLVIAGPRSGSGKTTVTLGLLRALAQDGVAVGGAKCGPDYIDPAFHARAAGRPSMNLDSWAMPPAALVSLARATGAGCELVICEGLMGLFDGVPADAGRSGSSADIAAALGWPVVLVHDASGQAQSAAAQIVGCARFDPRIRIAGVILNRVGSERHRRLVASALEPFAIPVLGTLPKAEHLALPERHLGLVQAAETSGLDDRLDAIAAFVRHHVDLATIRAIAAPGIDTGPSAPPLLPPPGQRIALAQDAAFSFIYPHVVEGWRQAGASVAPFSPLADEAPSMDCDICWLPGGYPELHCEALVAANRFRTGLRHFAETRPVHGECGGYMVMGDALTDAAGRTHPMAGLLSHATSFAARKLHLGYRAAAVLHNGIFGCSGTALRGHEFHYATITDPGTDQAFASVRDAYGAVPNEAGSRRGQVSGSFFHVIAAA